MYRSNKIHTQNDLLLHNLMEFFNIPDNVNTMINIINGESRTSLRIVDWFVTNYAKKYYTIYNIESTTQPNSSQRFKVYNEYKLKLKAYQKKRFDPFCRWDRITIPYNETQCMETTIGQLNFFKWAIENKVIDYIQQNHDVIESDMNSNNSTSKRRSPNDNTKTRKKTRDKILS